MMTGLKKYDEVKIQDSDSIRYPDIQNVGWKTKGGIKSKINSTNVPFTEEQAINSPDMRVKRQG